MKLEKDKCYLLSTSGDGLNVVVTIDVEAGASISQDLSLQISLYIGKAIKMSFNLSYANAYNVE